MDPPPKLLWLAAGISGRGAGGTTRRTSGPAPLFVYWVWGGGLQVLGSSPEEITFCPKSSTEAEFKAASSPCRGSLAGGKVATSTACSHLRIFVTLNDPSRLASSCRCVTKQIVRNNDTAPRLYLTCIHFFD